MKDKYLDFYKINFGTAKYCTKSWGLASFEAGAQSRQAEIDKLKSDHQLAESQLGYACVKWREIAENKQPEIDDLVDMVKTSADSEMNLFDELQRVSKDRDELQKRIGEALRHVADHGGYDDLAHVINILKGNNND